MATKKDFRVKDGNIILDENKKIFFDSTDTYIYADTDSSEDLHIGSDGHIELEPDNDLIVKVGSTEYVRFDGSAQRVGIGTATPGHLLDVAGDARFGTTGVAGKIYLSADSAGSFIAWNAAGNDVTLAADDDLILHADDALALESGGTVTMTLTNGGNVGIGTTSATASLDVAQGGASNLMTIIGGADIGATTRTNDTRKFFRMGMPHYHNAEEPFNLLCGDSSGTQNKVIIGGGTSLGNAATDIVFNTAANDATTTGTTRMQIKSDGNVGIGTTSPNHKLEVNGSFAATTKSFDIEHPTKEGMRLHHGSLEGPEHGVYVRGRLEGNEIELPDYWLGLVDEDTITVQLTPNRGFQQIYVEDISDNKVYVGTQSDKPIDCFYFIQAERKDVDKMEVEY